MPRIPLSSLVLEAVIIALLMSSGHLLLLIVTTVKSIKETLGVGTLIAVPSNFPFKTW